jgi:hypothetical protein
MRKPWWTILAVQSALVACSGDSERGSRDGSRGGESGTGGHGGQGSGTDGGDAGTTGGGAGETEGGSPAGGGRSGGAGPTSGAAGRDSGGGGGAAGGGSCQCTGLTAVRPDAEIDCVSGRCQLDPEDCLPGRADCDGDPRNGCEAWTDFDLSNCGECGAVCPMLAGCRAGRCEFDACQPGYDRCESDNACLPLDTQQHCGACDRAACSFENTFPTCSGASSCLPPLCVPGHANCSGDAACETTITTSGGSCYPVPRTSHVLGVGGSHLAVAVGPDGTLMVAGGFAATGDFDPTNGVDVRTPTGIDGSAFISRYTAAGDYSWTLTLEGGSSWIDAVEFGPGGSIVVGGTHRGVTDLDPGSAELLRDSGEKDEGFLLGLNPDHSLAWARTLPTTGTNAGTTVAGIAVDVLGAVYATGSYFGEADFASELPIGELTAEYSTSKAYAVKYAPGDTFEWVWSPSGECQASGERVAVSGDRLWLAANVSGSCRFGEATAATTASDSQGISVVGLGPDGGLTNWGLLDRANGVTQVVTTETSVFFVGYIASPADLDPFAGVDQRTLPGGGAHAVKITSGGAFAWAQTFGGFQITGAAPVSADRLLITGSGPRSSSDTLRTAAVLLVNADASPGFTLDLGRDRIPHDVALAGNVLAVVGDELDDEGSKYFVDRYAWDAGSR